MQRSRIEERRAVSRRPKLALPLIVCAAALSAAPSAVHAVQRCGRARNSTGMMKHRSANALTSFMPKGECFLSEGSETLGGQETAVIKRPDVKRGDVRRFRLTLNILSKTPMGDHAVQVIEKYSRSVKDATKAGNSTFVYKFESGTAVMSGKEYDILKMLPVITISRSPEGKQVTVLEGGNAEGNPEVSGVLQQLSAMFDNFLPKQPVKPGGKWKLSYNNVNLMIGGAALVGEAELVGHEKVGEIDTLKIKFVAESEDKKTGGKKHTEGALNVDAVTGELVRFEQKGAGVFAMDNADVQLIVEALSSNPKEDPKAGAK